MTSGAAFLLVVPGNGIAAPVGEPCGLGVRVHGHLLGVLQLGLGVLEIGGGAGAPEGVVAEAVGLDSGL